MLFRVSKSQRKRVGQRERGRERERVGERGENEVSDVEKENEILR
jgi:hypothetical protein